MATKKTKKIPPFLMPVLLVVLIAAMFLVYRVMDAQNRASTPGVETGSDVTMILEREIGDVNAVGYTYKGEVNDFTWNEKTGLWEVKGDKTFQLTQEPITTMANALTAIGVYRTLEDGDSGLYGFDSPEVEVRIGYKDGETHRYAIGDLNTVSGYRYLKDLDTGSVHTISAALLPYFQYTLDDLFAYDALPTDMTPTYIDSVTLSLDGEEAVITEEADRESFYTRFQLLTPTEYADRSGTDAAMDKYGIGVGSLTIKYKKPVTVTDTSGNANTTHMATTYVVRFGETTADGKVPYIIDTSNVIYLADGADLDQITALFQ